MICKSFTFLAFVEQILKRAELIQVLYDVWQQNLRPDNVNFAIYLDPNLIVNSVSLFILCPELFDSLSILLVSESNKSHVSISIHP